MSFTLQDCINWVQTDVLKRSDMTAAITDACVNFYTVLTRKIPFDELQTTSPEYNVIPNQAAYDLASGLYALDPPLKAISSIRMTYGPSGASSVRLRRSSTRLYDAISYTNMSSRPSTYARWGNTIELNPPPNSATYTYRVRYWRLADLSAGAATEPPIRDEWAELIKWETLYRAYYYLEKYEQAMALVMPNPLPRQPSPRRQVMYEVGIIPRLWNDLLSTISAMEAPDEDFGINPVVRNYSQQQ